MRRRGFVLVMAVVMGLSACRGTERKSEEASEPVEQTEDVQEVPSETEGKLDVEAEDGAAALDEGSEETNGGLDNFDADMGEAMDFAALIKEAVAEKDLGKLAELTGFLVYVGLDGVDVVETKEAFLELDPEAVFSEEMRRSIEKADAADLEASMAGFTLMDYDTQGSASVTFGVVNGEMVITGINYGY